MEYITPESDSQKNVVLNTYTFSCINTQRGAKYCPTKHEVVMSDATGQLQANLEALNAQGRRITA